MPRSWCLCSEDDWSGARLNRNFNECVRGSEARSRIVIFAQRLIARPPWAQADGTPENYSPATLY
ncbi:hypothetical protein BRAS3843_1330029 [Bradyrhizobium sp. STM 3843]|nr:hypothetical protein BRAS3843_1330029 [Bradyrhizobium sp. STM 3843]